MRQIFGGLLTLAISSCQQESAPKGPDVVLRSFVNTMRQVHGSKESADSAYEMMWEPARENLQERARRASALSGRKLSPGEMIVPSWFALYLVPESTDVRIDGEWAEVKILGTDGASTVARCKLEEGGWKVALELPSLSAIRQRDEPD